jgi:septal ring factor EnvC (AmiA/AmiB activator)
MRQPGPLQGDARLPATRGALRLRLAALLGAAVTAAVLAAGAQAPDHSQASALDRRAAARIQDLRREADSLASRERTLVEELRKFEVERDLRAAELAQRTRELDRIQSDLDRTAARILDLEQASASQLPDLSARMVELYKIGNGGYLRLLLNVDDVREMGRAYRFVSGLQGFDRQRVIEHRRTLADLRKAQAAIEARRVEARQAQDDVARAQQSAAQAVAAHEDLIRRIDARRDLAGQLAGELETARKSLQRTLDDAARDGAAAGSVVPTLPIRPFKGDLDWPVSGPIAGYFGRQVDPRFHTATVSNGVRIAAAPARPVAAIHDGLVVFASTFAGFGKLVIVDHGAAAFSLYGYLADIDVTSGERVSREQVLGSVGAGPNGEPGLYFELRIDGKPVDPLQWLRRK